MAIARRNATDKIRSLYSLVAILVMWELVGQFGLVHYYFLPPLSDIILQFIDLFLTGELLYHSQLTVYRALVGWILAGLFGVSIGILMGRISSVRQFFEPLVTFGYPVPKISLVPVFVLWFGIGNFPKIVLVAFGCFFPIVVNTYRGAEQVDQKQIWSAKMMGTSDWQILYKVIVPSSMPAILTGLQVALPVSLIITFVFEMVAGGGGLGFLEIRGVREFNPTSTYSALFAIMMIGFVFDRGFRFIRRRLLHWE